MSNPSAQTIDSRLVTIDHYRAYPAMLPYIGTNYTHPSHRKLLLIGESNYLPNSCVVHHDVKGWYGGSQAQLSAEEVRWIDNRGLLLGKWDQAGHEMYRELDRCLSEVVGKADGRATTHASYMNAFQRPSCKEGMTFKFFCTADDVSASASVVNDVVAAMQLELVIFVSKYAWDRMQGKIHRPAGVCVDFACHPTSSFWWRRKDFHSLLAKMWPQIEALLPAHKLICVYRDRIESFRD